MKITLLPALLALATTACAGRQEVATLAGKTTAVLNDYRQELTAFARHQTAISQGNERRLSQVTQLREQQQARIDRRLTGWRLDGDKAALEAYAVASEMGADQLLARTEALRTATPVSREVAAVRFDAAQVEAVVKKLKTLEQSPTFWDNVLFSVAYGKDLHAAYKDSVADAADEGSDAAAEATAVQTATVLPNQ